MIGIGVWIESEARYRDVLLPTLAAHAGSDTVLLESRGHACAFAAAEEILDGAAQLAELEALVVLRDDVEIRDTSFVAKARDAASTHPLTIAGPVGARHVTSLRWWEGDVVGGLDHGAGTIGTPPEGWIDAHVLHDAALVLSPRAVRQVRCDRGIWSGAYGLAAELCSLVRVCGGAVGVVDVPLSQGTFTRPADTYEFLRADTLWRARWSLLPSA